MIATATRSAGPASLLTKLRGIRDAGRFEHIWLDATWLDDGAELRRDHDAIETLLRVAAETDCADRARTALQLAIRLLRLHANSGCAALRALRTSMDYVLLLAEQIETQLAQQDFLDDPILIARLATLRLHAGILARFEREYCEDAPASRSESGPAFARSPTALRTRTRLLREAQRVVNRKS